jgi:hypothetical protein
MTAAEFKKAKFYLVPLPKRTGPPRTKYPLMKARHAQALGYMVAHWSVMDSTLGFFITILTGLRGDAAFVMNVELSSLQRAAVIRALLFETREQKWVDDWEDLMPRFEALRTLRNDAVHGLWHDDKGAYHAFRVSAKGRVSKRSVEISTARLNQLTEDTIALYGEIDTMAFRIGKKAAARLRRFPTKPPLVPGQGRNSRAQAQARAAKQAQKQASRERAALERATR